MGMTIMGYTEASLMSGGVTSWDYVRRSINCECGTPVRVCHPERFLYRTGCDVFFMGVGGVSRSGDGFKTSFPESGQVI